MKQRCDICRGSKFIRLPIYRPLVAVEGPDVPTVSEPTNKMFPCPQCGDKTSVEEVGVLEVGAQYDIRISDPDYKRHMKRSMAVAVAEKLLDDGFIEFSEMPVSDDRGALRATVGVVHPSEVTSLQVRVEKAASLIAYEVAAEAIGRINNWGSYYGDQSILKEVANREIFESAKQTLNKRASAIMGRQD